VQWHPEALTERDGATRRLFAEFVEAAGESRAATATA
jgi:gamma-glutamyl-gamma-aminobutyrate hydrolase PuuD